MSSFCIIYHFRKILDILRNFFGLLVVIFCGDLEIEIYMSREIFSAEIFESKNTFFIVFRLSDKKFLDSWQNIWDNFSKLHFTCQEKKIQEILCFESVMVSLNSSHFD